MDDVASGNINDFPLTKPTSPSASMGSELEAFLGRVSTNKTSNQDERTALALSESDWAAPFTGSA